MSERQRERDEKEEEGGKIEGGERVREWADQGRAGGDQSIQEERGLGRKRGEERGKMGGKDKEAVRDRE